MEPKSDVLSSQAELAALAAHLLAHQTRYHLDDAIDAEAKVLVPEVRAAVGSNMATPGGTRVATVDLWHTFSDAEEMEADSAAIIALQRANWDATALRTLWQRLDGGSPKPALFKRHPLTPARLAAIEAAERLRLQGSDLVMTQELIANMLGVRREGVTNAAMNLQRAGLITYARGHIHVVDRQGLEQRTCECYAVVKQEYDRLLHPDKLA